jgi:hypoxanthine phosphoribosyltransferase
MKPAFVEVVDEATIRTRVAQLGSEISRDYRSEDPVVIGVLKGSVPFLADLTRHLSPHIETDFLALTRFGHDGRVGIAMDISIPVTDRSVLIVENIVDTGLTLTTLRKMLVAKGAADVRTVALIDKTTRRIVDVPVEYRGFEVGDEFLLGYGLDWEGRYRNVRSFWAVMDLARLKADPDSFGEVAYRAGAPASG